MAGEKQTFDAGTTLPESAEDVASGIGFITRSVSSLLVAIGVPDDLKPVHRIKHEWLEEALLPNSTLVNGSQTNAETTIEVTAGTGTRFRVGDLLQVDESREIMLVGTANANDVVVTRGVRGSSGEAIADGATIKRISTPALEDAGVRTVRFTQRTRPANFTQIFKDTAGVTRSESKTKQLGEIEDELAHQVMMTKRDLMRDYAYSLINGRADATNPEGTDSVERTMDGIIPLIIDGADPAIFDAASTPIDEAALNTGLQAAHDRGGNPNWLFASSKQKRGISAIFEGRWRTGPQENIGGVVIDTFQSDFGTLRVSEPDFFIPPDVIIGLDLAKISPVMLGEEGDDMFDEDPIGKDGSTDKIEVIGELGLELLNAGDGGHVLWQNLS